MKIQATCDTCDRRFLLSQIGPDSDAPGRCPFCGARFARHYTTILVDAVRDVEVEAARFVSVLSKLQAMETGFDIELEDFLQTLNREIRENESIRAS